MSLSCAICTRPIAEPALREPRGLNDALVPVCEPCATEPVVPKENIPVRILRRPPANEHAQRIREHRDRLRAQGLCVNGAAHGASASGQLCTDCAERNRRSERRRQRSS